MGKDDFGQVKNAPTNPGMYIQIEAGNGTGSALTHNGTIITWGKSMYRVPGSGNFTDIALGPGDWGFAMRESVPELHITAPLSPDTDVQSREGTPMHIPKGALFEHTGNGVMRVLDANGKMLFWVNDDETDHVTFPEGTAFPLSAIHYLPKQSLILNPENYEATVYGQDTSSSDLLKMAEQPPLMNLTTASWRDEMNASSQQLTPQGICFADTGCGVGATSRGQLFLNKPQALANGNIPVFSVQKVNDTMYVGKITMFGSTDAINDQEIQIEKNRIDPDQPVKINIMKSAAGAKSDPDKGVVLTAQANLTNQSSVLHYTITGTVSVSQSEMNLTPNIWKKTDAGDVLVFVGKPVTCRDTLTCIATGNFTSNATASYFANATVLYTVPTTVDGVVGTQPIAMIAETGVRPCAVSCQGPPSGDYFAFTINSVKLEGHTEWQNANCYDNEMIRWAKAGKSSSLKSNLTPNLWKENKDCTTEYSFAVDSPANKPVYLGAVYKNAVEDPDVWSHAVAAELLDTSLKPEDTKWANWKFFQYDNLDITSGDWKKNGDYQIPLGGASVKTKVQIKSNAGIINGSWTTETVHIIFYVNSTGDVSKDPNPPYMSGYVLNPTKKALIKNDAVPTELQTIIGSVGRNDSFSLNKWEWNSTSNEITFYVFDILDEGPIREIQGKKIGNYSVHIIHDTEFEETRNGVGQQLYKNLKDPAYQIAHIAMNTNRISDPPENSAELWVHRSTPENEILDNTVINGWTIHVYPISG